VHIPPPSGRRRSWAHYGVMMPGLPEPHRAFGVMSIVGTPGVRIFDNDDLIATTPNDTAYLVSATSSMSREQFRAYRIAEQCDFAADGSHLRFGNDLTITGRYPAFSVHRRHPEVEVRLDITATDTITHFVRLGPVYSHWSVLGRARGRILHRGVNTDIAGLCTIEYAAGVGLHSVLDRRLPGRVTLPSRFFTYHVLNVDDETQLLFTYVLGPAGIPVQKAVHVRSLRTGAISYRRGHSFLVHEYEPQPRRTPDGRSMRLPLRFTWRVDADGRPIEVHGTTNGDFAYGLGAGYVGTYDYDATFRGRAISGCAYMEFIDCR
jgi:hypothetical protein